VIWNATVMLSLSGITCTYRKLIINHSKCIKNSRLSESKDWYFRQKQVNGRLFEFKNTTQKPLISWGKVFIWTVSTITPSTDLRNLLCSIYRKILFALSLQYTYHHHTTCRLHCYSACNTHPNRQITKCM